ncbi:MAG: hypothetical protein HY553_18120 [Elusimicrobia bacterium]|nr:hypothetical protein [Elusimicrobiota bacterium]
MNRTTLAAVWLACAPSLAEAQTMDRLVVADRTSVDATRRHTEAAKQRAGEAFDGAVSQDAKATRLRAGDGRRVPPGPSDSGGPVSSAAPAPAAKAPVEKPKSEKNVTPYQDQVDLAQMLLMAGGLLLVGANLVEKLPLSHAAMIAKGMRLAAAALGAAVIAIAFSIMGKHEQKMQSVMLILGGLMLIVGAIASGAFSGLGGGSGQPPAGTQQPSYGWKTGPGESTEVIDDVGPTHELKHVWKSGPGESTAVIDDVSPAHELKHQWETGPGESPAVVDDSKSGVSEYPEEVPKKEPPTPSAKAQGKGPVKLGHKLTKTLDFVPLDNKLYKATTDPYAMKILNNPVTKPNGMRP